MLMHRLINRILSLTVLLALPLSSAFAASAYVHELTGTLTGQYGTAAPRALSIGENDWPRRADYLAGYQRENFNSINT